MESPAARMLGFRVALCNATAMSSGASDRADIGGAMLELTTAMMVAGTWEIALIAIAMVAMAVPMRPMLSQP